MKKGKEDVAPTKASNKDRTANESIKVLLEQVGCTLDTPAKF